MEDVEGARVGEGAGGVSRGARGLELPALPWNDWEIKESDVAICRRPDGSEWELGGGAFGKVGPTLLQWQCCVGNEDWVLEYLALNLKTSEAARCSIAIRACLVAILQNFVVVLRWLIDLQPTSARLHSSASARNAGRHP